MDNTKYVCDVCGSVLEYHCWVEHNEIHGVSFCGYVCVNKACKNSVYEKSKPFPAYIHAPKRQEKEIHE